jgi:hypothetical protein
MFCCFVSVAFSVLSSQATHAQQSGVVEGKLTLELNSAGTVGSSCRLTFVATNRTAAALQNVSYTFALYEDLDGTPTVDANNGLFVFDFGALPVEGSRVMQFDVGDKDCNILTRVSSNGFKECKDASGNDATVCEQDLVQRTGATAIIFD